MNSCYCANREVDIQRLTVPEGGRVFVAHGAATSPLTSGQSSARSCNLVPYRWVGAIHWRAWNSIEGFAWFLEPTLISVDRKDPTCCAFQVWGRLQPPATLQETPDASALSKGTSFNTSFAIQRDICMNSMNLVHMLASRHGMKESPSLISSGYPARCITVGPLLWA